MNKKYFFILLAVVAGLAVAIGIAFSAARAGTALLSLDPQSTVRGPGETVSMTIQLESATLASGADVYLNYDPSILLVLDADTLTDTVQIHPGTCPDPEFIIQNQANILSGTINYAVVDLGIDAGCTSGVVATIEFQCVGLGTSDIVFGPETELSDPEGITITLTTQNAAITCTDVTSTPGPTATPTGSATPTATLTPTATTAPPDIYLPVLKKDLTPTPTPTLTPTPTNTPTATPLPWVTILEEKFEGAFPGVWQLSSNTGGNYHWGKRSCRVFQDAYSAWIIGGGTVGSSTACGSNYPAEIDNWMVYGPFSLEGMTEARMTFQTWIYSEINYDYFCVAASGVGGFTPSNYEGSCYSGNSSGVTGNVNGWISLTLDLADIYQNGTTSFLGDPSVYVTFRFVNDDSIQLAEGAYVDNVVLQKCAGSCPVTQISLVQETPNFISRPIHEILPGPSK